MKLYSYVLRFDDGAAPNPFGGYCTLTICKPKIRRVAKVGDWVIGTGSKNGMKKGAPCDLQDKLVYAMKISKVISLEKYEQWCRKNAKIKLPIINSADYKERSGDCIYDYSKPDSEGIVPNVRKSVHSISAREHDLSGKNALVSDYFYYFGENAVDIDDDFLEIVKRNMGHKTIQDEDLIKRFIVWLEKKYKKTKLNKIVGSPQMPVPANKAERTKQCKLCAKDDACEDEIIVSSRKKTYSGTTKIKPKKNQARKTKSCANKK